MTGKGAKDKKEEAKDKKEIEWGNAKKTRRNVPPRLSFSVFHSIS